MSAPTTTRPLEQELLGPAAEAAQGLHERFAAQVFGYCLGRLGDRLEAEAALEKTFVRAAGALARGELPDPERELSWLLRFSERICGSRRRRAWIRARSQKTLSVASLPEADSERVRIVRDWQGLTVDEIAADYEARQRLVTKARSDLASSLSPWRRPLAVLDFGAAFGWIKSALTGLSALKATAAAVAVTASVVVVATPIADRLHEAVRPASGPRTPAPQQPASEPTGRPATPKPQPARPAGRPSENAKPAADNGKPPVRSRPVLSRPGRTLLPATSPSNDQPVLSQPSEPPAAPAPAVAPEPAAPAASATSSPTSSSVPVPKPEPKPAVSVTGLPEPTPVDTPPLPEPQLPPTEIPAPLPAPPVSPVAPLPPVDTPQVPDVPAPKDDLPKVDVPKVDAPKVEVPKVDVPKVDVPTVTLPGP